MPDAGTVVTFILQQGPGYAIAAYLLWKGSSFVKELRDDALKREAELKDESEKRESALVQESINRETRLVGVINAQNEIIKEQRAILERLTYRIEEMSRTIGNVCDVVFAKRE